MVARGRRDNVAFASSSLLLLLLLNVVTTWRSRAPHRRMEALLAYDFNDMKWDFYACPGGAIGEWTVSSLGVKARPAHLDLSPVIELLCTTCVWSSTITVGAAPHYVRHGGT